MMRLARFGDKKMCGGGAGHHWLTIVDKIDSCSDVSLHKKRLGRRIKVMYASAMKLKITNRIYV